MAKKVFITGSTGLVGSACVTQMVAAGHNVTGLSRSDDGVQRLEKAGATAIKGNTDDLDLLKKCASEADAVVHLAFNHELMFTGKVQEAGEKDLAAIKALGDGLLQAPSSNGNKKVLLYSSGLLGLGGKDENAPSLGLGGNNRYKSGELVLSHAEKGLRAIVVRLAPIVHGDDRMHPFVSHQIDNAKKNGYVSVVGDGQNKWVGCNVEDCADLFVRALDKGPDSGFLHAASESFKVADLAKVIAKHTNLETKSVSAEEASKQLGFVGHILAVNTDVSWELTKERTGWAPSHVGLFEQMEKNYTF